MLHFANAKCPMPSMNSVCTTLRTVEILDLHNVGQNFVFFLGREGGISGWPALQLPIETQVPDGLDPRGHCLHRVRTRLHYPRPALRLRSSCPSEKTTTVAKGEVTTASAQLHKKHSRAEIHGGQAASSVGSHGGVDGPGGAGKMHRGERLCIFASPLSSNAYCLFILPPVLEDETAMQ
jgi:hypothetical protein